MSRIDDNSGSMKGGMPQADFEPCCSSGSDIRFMC